MSMFMPEEKSAAIIRELKERKRAQEAEKAAAGTPRAELRAVPRPRPLSAEELEARRTRAIAEARADAASPAARDGWLMRVGVEVRFRRAAIEEELVPRELRRWAAGFPDSLEGASVLLAGKPGGGKTVSSVWLLQQVYRCGRIEDDGYGGSARWVTPDARFVPASDLFTMCFDREERKPLDALERVAVLVVDDWGLPYESDWALAQLDRLIDRRWARMLTTIVSTNLAPEGESQNTFQARYPRIYSRLCDTGGPGVVTIRREDLRRAKP